MCRRAPGRNSCGWSIRMTISNLWCLNSETNNGDPKGQHAALLTLFFRQPLECRYFVRETPEVMRARRTIHCVCVAHRDAQLGERAYFGRCTRSEFCW